MGAVDPRGTQGLRRASWGYWAVWLLLGLVFLLALLLPPSGDDWRRIDFFSDHTVSGYLDRSRRFYLGHNGRVLPYVLSFLFMDLWWLRALVKAVTVVGLVLLVGTVSGVGRGSSPRAGGGRCPARCSWGLRPASSSSRSRSLRWGCPSAGSW